MAVYYGIDKRQKLELWSQRKQDNRVMNAEDFGNKIERPKEERQLGEECSIIWNGN